MPRSERQLGARRAVPLQAWAGGQGLPGDYGELCRSEQAQSMVQRELEAAGRAAGLKVRLLASASGAF